MTTQTGKDLGLAPDNPFYDAEVVSTYTDEQAVDDGTLVDLGNGHRATRPLFNFAADHLGDTPPTGWPVELMGYFTARSKAETLAEVGLRRAVAALRGLVGTYAAQATKVYEENIGGGIFEGFIQQGAGDIITGFDRTDKPTTGGIDGDRKVWFIPNGDGVTVMFPSDY